MPKVDIEQRHAQHRAVGGDERQENAQQAIQGRAGFPHHHLGKLHHNRNDQNKGQGAQVEHVERIRIRASISHAQMEAIVITKVVASPMPIAVSSFWRRP